MDDRLARWSCWASERGVLRSAGVSSVYRCASEVVGSDWDRTVSWSARVPYQELEAQQTDKAVRALPAPLRQVVAVVYIRDLAGTKDRQARMLRISRVSLHRRLCEVDVALARWFDGERAARVAVQALAGMRAV